MDEILGTLTNLTSEDNEDLTSGDLNGASVILDNVAVNAVERPESLTVDQLEVCIQACCETVILLIRMSLKYR